MTRPPHALHLLGADHGVERVVRAFDQEVRAELRHQREGRILLEDANEIDGGKAGEHGSARRLGLHRAACALEPPDARVAVEADDEPVAGRAGLLEQVDVAGMEEIEAAVGEADAPAPAAPALDLLDRRLARKDLAQTAPLGAERGEQLLGPRGSSADLADHDAGGDVGQPCCRGQLEAARYPGGQRRHHRIAGAGDIEHLGRLGRKMLWAGLVEQRHPVLGPRHQHGAEAVRHAERRGGRDQRGLAVDRHSTGFRKLAAVGCYDIGAGIAAVIRALGIDDHGAAQFARRAGSARLRCRRRWRPSRSRRGW